MEKAIIYFILLATHLASYYKIFQLAGRKPWEALIPGYNVIILLKILERPWYWALVLIFPGVNVLMVMILNVNTIKAMSKDGFVDQLGAILLPFVYMPYVAYKDSGAAWIGPEDRTKQKRSGAREWGDAILFAVIAASIIRGYFIEAFTIPTSSMEKSLLIGDFLFVSKVAYGPKIPQTPLSFPFAHHTMPGTADVASYLTWMHLDHHRLPGLGDVERNDVVVFNYPEGDTVFYAAPTQSYYAILRNEAIKLREREGGVNSKRPLNFYIEAVRKDLLKRLDYTVRPVDKRENYIKRCVGIPGDKLEVRNGTLIVNDEDAFLPDLHQFDYKVGTKEAFRFKHLKQKYNVNLNDIDPKLHQGGQRVYTNRSEVPLTTYMADSIAKDANATSVEVQFSAPGEQPLDLRIFPNHPDYTWNADNFGPITIPKKGATVQLTVKNLPEYRRLINIYENNDLRVDGTTIYINGEAATEYTFQMDYFFMMGDNRHNSADSRFWGFVPEDHVVGKAMFVWFSYDKELDWSDGKLRLNRFFSGID